MKKWHYYNEIDPKCCEWIKQLITAGLVPDGEIDSRSIVEVKPDDITGFVQCHFFGGILGWPLALKLAGWPEDRPVWTASLPCQPFSCAGEGLAEADERHLWPYFRNLVAECRPPIIFGEQVTSPSARRWLAGVRADLERAAFAVGAADLCAAGVGAPHRRQRFYWVAYACDLRRQAGSAPQPGPESGLALAQHGSRVDPLAHPQHTQRRTQLEAGAAGRGRDGLGGGGQFGTVADTQHDGRRSDESGRGPEGRAIDGRSCGVANPESGGQRIDGSAPRQTGHAECSGQNGVTLGDTKQPGLEGHSGHERNGSESRRLDTGKIRPITKAGAVNPWSNYALIQCRDGKTRRIEPSIPALVARLPKGMVYSGDIGASVDATAEARRMRLHGYGNTICAPLAAQFITAAYESIYENQNNH